MGYDDGSGVGGSGGGGSSGDGGASSGGGSNSNNPTKNKNACLTAADLDHEFCIALSRGTAIASVTMCAGFVHPRYIAVCSGAAAIGRVIGEYECNAAFINQKSDCNSLPG